MLTNAIFFRSNKHCLTEKPIILVFETLDAKVEGEAASYALEGSVAVAGLALRSKLI